MGTSKKTESKKKPAPKPKRPPGKGLYQIDANTQATMNPSDAGGFRLVKETMAEKLEKGCTRVDATTIVKS